MTRVDRLKMEIRHLDLANGQKRIDLAISRSQTSRASFESCLEDVLLRLRRGQEP